MDTPHSRQGSLSPQVLSVPCIVTSSQRVQYGKREKSNFPAETPDRHYLRQMIKADGSSYQWYWYYMCIYIQCDENGTGPS